MESLLQTCKNCQNWQKIVIFTVFYCNQPSLLNNTILGLLDHLSPKYGPLGSFPPNFEKTLNLCKEPPKFENLCIFYLVDSAINTAFQGVVIHISVDFCYGEIEFTPNIWPYGHTVSPYVSVSKYHNISAPINIITFTCKPLKLCNLLLSLNFRFPGVEAIQSSVQGGFYHLYRSQCIIITSCHHITGAFTDFPYLFE